MAIFFLAGAVGLFVVFIHPYATYPATLWLLRRRPISLIPGGTPSSATMVFCAYNEAASLPGKIENLRRIREVAPHVKFACYVDISTDATLAMLQAHADLIEVTPATERTGKAVGMSRLAKAADTEIMIFTDANVLIEPQSVPRLLDYFSDPEIGGVAGKLSYINAGASEMATTSSAYWRLEEIIKRLESRSGSTMGADGSLFATRRALYPDVPPHLMDDFIVSMSVIFAGKRLVSASDVHAYEHAATASVDEFRRKRRIACRAYSSHRFIASRVWRLSPLDRYKYVSHRWVRWHGFPIGCVGGLLGLCFIATAFGPAPAIVLAGLGVMALWGGARFNLKGFRHAYEALTLLCANSLGVIDALNGKTYQIWQPPQRV